MEFIKNLETAIEALIQSFCEKQECDFEFAVGDDITGILCFGYTYYFSLSDVYYDIKTNQPKGQIFNWQDDNLEYQDENKFINYEAYSNGLRYKDLK